MYPPMYYNGPNQERSPYTRQAMTSPTVLVCSTISGGAGAVPIPGLSIVTNIVLVEYMKHHFKRKYGLRKGNVTSPLAVRIASGVGSYFAADIMWYIAVTLGAEAIGWVPIAGQVASAVICFTGT